MFATSMIPALSS